MRYWLLASIVTLSSFALALLLTGLLEALAVERVAAGIADRSPSQRSSILFWLRLLPLAVATVFAVALVLPTFLYYEPIHTDEPLTKTMLMIAAVGALIVQRTIVRLVRIARTTGRLARRWRAAGRRISDLAPGVPTFEVDEPFPIVAVVGWIRPALFVSGRVFAECTPEEIEAMVSHEQAHIAARDNFKRLLLYGSPNVPFAARLESSWSAATEEAADARAAAAKPHRRLDLASALIRLARLAPEPGLPAGVSAFYPGGGIEDRVRHLLEPVESAPPTYGCAMMAFGGSVLALAFVVSAPAIHTAMEALVRLVP